MHKYKTIGHWLNKHPEITMRNVAHWEVRPCCNGTYAVVKMQTLLLRNSNVIAIANHGIVWRGQSAPMYEQWNEGSSLYVGEAKEAVVRMEKTDMSDTPCSMYVGFNHALPWEKLPEPKLGWKTRLKLWWLSIGL